LIAGVVLLVVAGLVVVVLVVRRAGRLDQAHHLDAPSRRADRQPDDRWCRLREDDRVEASARGWQALTVGDPETGWLVGAEVPAP
jgi:hypothetical protein